MTRTSLILMCIWSLWQEGSLEAAIVINEVMSNEPGGSTSLEWIELYNTATSGESLSGYSLAVDSNLLPINSSRIIPAYDYLIVCRRLLSSSGSSSFEDYWGNGSGYWGDTPDEAALLTPLELTISLANSAGMIFLINSVGDSVSSFEWTSSGRDGFSWERTIPDSNRIEQSCDFEGSTPGFTNSVTPLGRDLGIDSLFVSGSLGYPVIEVSISARSLEPTDYSALFLSKLNSDTLAFLALGIMQPGETRAFSLSYDAIGEYIELELTLNPDDRSRNNRLTFVGCGDEFPALLLNEIMAAPAEGLNTEWIELYNRSSRDVDLSNWSLGDINTVHVPIDSSLLIPPDEYIVVVRDSNAFLSFYSPPRFIVQASSWATLNNTADTVVLEGDYGIEADRFQFSDPPDNNITYSRDESSGWPSRWGLAATPGGSPGSPNETILPASQKTSSITIAPNPFSPDGDGFEDNTIISINSVTTGEFQLKVYDRQGRVVKDLGKEAQNGLAEVIWGGRSDAGKRLPVGIYIIYFESAEAGSIKKTVVIAR